MKKPGVWTQENQVLIAARARDGVADLGPLAHSCEPPRTLNLGSSTRKPRALLHTLGTKRILKCTTIIPIKVMNHTPFKGSVGPQGTPHPLTGKCTVKI